MRQRRRHLRRSGLLAAVLAALSLVIQPGPALAEDGTTTASISGHVASVTGADLTGVRVSAYRQLINSSTWVPQASALTDEDGRFTITSPGRTA